MHQREVLGAGDVHRGQRASDTTAGLIGVQHRRAGQQGLHMRLETLLQFAGRAPTDAGQKPSRDIDATQHLPAGPDSGLPADNARTSITPPARWPCGPIRTGDPGIETTSAHWSPVCQAGMVITPQPGHTFDTR